MRQQFIFVLGICAAFTTALQGQGIQRQASIRGMGSPDSGKCTIEVNVDSVAEVEIRGTRATLRTLNGQPAEWRRFECNSPMPNNPIGFRFTGVDGRGRQTLVRDPERGGVAVIRIEDKDNGREGYTFDIFWGGGNYQGGRPPVDVRPDDRRREASDPRNRPGSRDSEYYRRNGRGFTVEEAVRVCQDSIAEQTKRRFRNSDIRFGRTRIDDNPGRNNWVLGSVDVSYRGRTERYGFSCSVNFDNGNVRSAKLDERPLR